MKRIRISLLTLITITTSVTSAYSPTTDDVEELKSLITTIENLIDDDKPTHYSFIRQLDALTHTHKDGKVWFLLHTLHGYLTKELHQKKSQTHDDIRTMYQDFIDTYADDIQNDSPLHPNCIEYIDELDTLAYVHNVSLPVLIGTRWRETTCGYYLPSNGDGVMQIVSHDYGTGEIQQHEDFFFMMENYIDFANAKYDRYNRVTDSGEPITIDYTTISYDDIIKHGALYNSLSWGTIYGDIAPTNPWYVFDNYTDAYSGSTRDGLLPVVIKTMQRWLENRL